VAGLDELDAVKRIAVRALEIARGHDVRHFETKDLETILSEDAGQVRGEIVGQFQFPHTSAIALRIALAHDAN